MVDNENRQKLYSRYLATQAGPNIDEDAGASYYGGKAYKSYFGPLLPHDKACRILDLGCGRGQFMAFLSSEGYNVVQGVEFSDDQVEYAKKAGISSIVQCDIKDFLRTSSAQWDCILAIDVMEHFNTNEVLAITASIFERLAPGGRFIMRSPNGASPFFGSIRYADLTHETAFTPVSVQQLFRNVGFQKFGVRDCGPPFHGIKSTIRAIAWRAIATAYKIFTVIEMGYAEKIFSRNLIAWAEKA